MREQKVNLDAWSMLTTSFSYIGLVVSAWVLLRLVNACFWFPSFLQENDKKKQGVEENGRCPKATPRIKQETAGLSLAGVAVASSCQIVLPVFGALFVIVGAVLTIASYRGPEEDEDADQYADRVNLTSNLRILGPCCLAIGIGMFLSGLALCLLSRRARNQKMTFHCPVHGDFYPLSANNDGYSGSRKRPSLAMCGQMDSVEEMTTMPTPQCPHSNRNSLTTGGGSSPLPPVLISHSSSGFLTPNTMTLGENSGSTQSLAISYDVASFPHSPCSSVLSDKETRDESVT